MEGAGQGVAIMTRTQLRHGIAFALFWGGYVAILVWLAILIFQG